MTTILLAVVVVGVGGCGLFLISRWRADRSDPYVTLSDRKMRLDALTKKSGAK
jgi:hypothetical protein